MFKNNSNSTHDTTYVLLKYIEFCLEILARPKMESQIFFTNFSNFCSRIINPNFLAPI